MPKAKYWVFTSFKEDEPIFDEDKHSYLTYQREKSPSTGREHWQGYVEMRRSCARSEVQGSMGDEAIHLEPSRSAAAIAYCHKPETRVGEPREHGRRPDERSCKRGGRSDLYEVGEFIKSGGSVADAGKKFTETFIKYHGGISKLWGTIQSARDASRAICVELYWGATGTGKTRRAFEENRDAYWKPVGKWWDGYTGQSTVIFDDFNGDKDIPIGQLLRILDRYPIRVEYKGGSTELQAIKFIFTSNVHWKQWYDWDSQNWRVHFDAFQRRITKEEKFGNVDDFVDFAIVE